MEQRANDIQAKILKRQNERNAWLDIHKEDLTQVFIERFGISYDHFTMERFSSEYKEALKVAYDDAEKYMDDNNFNKNDSAGVSIIKIELRKQLQ